MNQTPPSANSAPDFLREWEPEEYLDKMNQNFIEKELEPLKKQDKKIFSFLLSPFKKTYHFLYKEYINILFGQLNSILNQDLGEEPFHKPYYHLLSPEACQTREQNEQPFEEPIIHINPTYIKKIKRNKNKILNLLKKLKLHHLDRIESMFVRDGFRHLNYYKEFGLVSPNILNMRNTKGKTAFMHIITHKPYLLKDILSSDSPFKIDINLPGDTGWGENGWTPLMYALYCRRMDLVKVFMEQGASIHQKDQNGWNALILAIHRQMPDYIIEELLELGADINSRDKNQKTPLMFLVMKHPQLILKFIELGADIQARDSQNRTVLDFAYKNHQSASILQQWFLDQLLLQKQRVALKQDIPFLKAQRKTNLL